MVPLFPAYPKGRCHASLDLMPYEMVNDRKYNDLRLLLYCSAVELEI
jgi:hypothetical protein